MLEQDPVTQTGCDPIGTPPVCHTRRPRLLDLYCCAGGAAAGYARAGFQVVGVDINPQPNYPYLFVQGDALQFAARNAHHFDAIHTSPPCQVHSALAPLAGPGHIDLIPETRAALTATALPYVIENVVGAPLRAPYLLCGSMFGLGAAGRTLKRHRLFETNFPITTPPDSCKGRPIGGVYGDGGGGSMRGYKFPVRDGRAAMGINWTTRRELSQAIPPAYTEHIGAQLLAHLAAERAA